MAGQKAVVGKISDEEAQRRINLWQIGGRLMTPLERKAAMGRVYRRLTRVTNAKPLTRDDLREIWPDIEAINGAMTEVPDCQIIVQIVPHGYDARVWLQGQEYNSGARDFGGSHRVKKLATELTKLLDETLTRFFRGK